MDFGALPPEINSARMYFGPGSPPMLAAAAVWDEVAGALHSTAASYQSVIAGLTAGSWLGPASASMAAAAAPYVGWMSTTAAQAEQTAAQARAAAGAFEAAFAMTVPPPVIAANRSLLMSLIATNILGQNTPAIAATEAHYAEMWAQDAAAMYGYAGASASAAQLSTFNSPPPTAHPEAVAQQGLAVGQATATSASTDTQAMLSQFVVSVPTALQQLASPTSMTSTLSSLNPVLSATSSAGWISSALLSNANQLHNLLPAASTLSQTAAASSATSGLTSGLAGGLGQSSLSSTAGLGAAAVSAGTGRAASIGALSVPPSWTATAPALSPAAALSGTGLGAASAAEAGEPASVLGGMPLASLEGRAGGGMVPDARFLERPAMVPRWWGAE
ncbi:PPE family protein [Mycobacterium kubicae]|uniref:PPE family protein n=1 Tax=Mycobacterium kubicae TaxID=120959 RepID=UPI00163FFD0F|nr:PPE family protein [Mycobacterium kubicae]QNI07760.1 PPE family protein [Mycobacterium kubicae]